MNRGSFKINGHLFRQVPGEDIWVADTAPVEIRSCGWGPREWYAYVGGKRLVHRDGKTPRTYATAAGAATAAMRAFLRGSAVNAGPGRPLKT